MSSGELPDVIGSGEMFYTGSGAFSSSSSIARYIRGGDSAAFQTRAFTFRASYSNSLYGSYGGVLPRCLVVSMCIKYI